MTPSAQRRNAEKRSKRITLLLILASLFFVVSVLALFPAYLTQGSPVTPPDPLSPTPKPTDTASSPSSTEPDSESSSLDVPTDPTTAPPVTSGIDTITPGSLGTEELPPLQTTPSSSDEPPTEPLQTEPPMTNPPVTEPPVTEPPITEPPVTDPPATDPPVTDPPMTEPPITDPPVTDPPITDPPVTDPPVTDPPVTDPPVTTPPVTDPPVTDPPITDPPVTDPPMTDPPVTNPSETDPPITGAPYVDLIDPEEFADVLVTETPEADEDYISKILFLGDSITNGMRDYGYLPGGKECRQILFPSSGTITLYHVKDVLVYDPEVQKDVTVLEAIGRRQPELLFIALGVNGIGWETENTFRKEYRDLLNAILSVSPDTTIVLQSMLPVGIEYRYPEMLNNEKIARGNQIIAQVAQEFGLSFLNLAPIMLDETGYASQSYISGDGLHLMTYGYPPILDFYKRHRIPGF